MTVSLKTVAKMMRVLDALVADKDDPFVLKDAMEVLREARAPYLSNEPIQRWRIRDKTAPQWFWSNAGGWVQEGGGGDYDRFLSKPDNARLPPDGEWEKFKAIQLPALTTVAWHPPCEWDQWR